MDQLSGYCQRTGNAYQILGRGFVAREHLAFLALLLLSYWTAFAASHPMDALSAGEIAATTAILKSAGKADDRTLFASITLLEPRKSFMLAWKPGDAIPRQASVVLRKDLKTYEAVVDLAAHEISSFIEVPGAQPFVTVPE